MRDVSSAFLYHMFVREDAEGQYTAGVVGLPEVRARSTTEEAALEEARRLLTEWVARVRFVQVQVVVPLRMPLEGLGGGIDPNDSAEKEYLEILAQFKREDLDKTY
jgi:hypothetical protein